MAGDPAREPPLPFRQRAIYTLLIATAVAVVLLLLWTLRWVFCVAFLAILFGVFLRSGADLLARVARPLVRLRPGASLALFCLLLLGVITLFFFVAVPSLSTQMALLRSQLPQSVEQIKRELGQSRWGTWLVQEGEAMVDQVRPETRPATTRAGSSPDGEDEAGNGQAAGIGGSGPDLARVFRRAAGWATSAFLAVVVLLFVIFTGLYLAIDPALYTRGVLWLVPPRGRRKADCVLKRVGHTLRYWIMGQLVAMALVGTVAGVGLWILGAPLPLVLGSLAGVAEFVPNVGPFIAAGLPTLLSATAEGRFLAGPSLAVAVLLMFIGIQTLESYVITPMIQQRAVEIPPALLITTQLAAAMLLGPVGVLIAAPLVASVMAALKELVVVGDPEHEHPKDRSHEGEATGGRPA